MSELPDDFGSELHGRADLGLPLPHGVRGRFLRRAFLRVFWPTLRQQLELNHELASALHEIDRRAGAASAALGEGLAHEARATEDIASNVAQLHARLSSLEGSTAVADTLARLEEVDRRHAELEIRYHEILLRQDHELARHQQVLERQDAALDQQQQIIARQDLAFDDFRGRIDNTHYELDVVQQQALESTQQAAASLQVELDELAASTGEAAKVAEVARAKVERGLADTWGRMAQLDLFLDLVRRHLPKPPDSDELAELPTAFDALYEALEAAFRGPEEIITERLRPYLEDVLPAGLLGPVLDVGSGRGEWLALLRSASVEAYGTDLSARNVERCREAGLNVRLGDAVSHLRQVAPESLGAVTGFHVVEHLNLDYLIELLDLSRSALHPGGVLILETPNPDNLVVGASSFWLDPSHRRPLPAPLLRFLVESRGFVDVSVRYWTRPEMSQQLAGPTHGGDAAELATIAELLNERLTRHHDYAVVARRPTP